MRWAAVAFVAFLACAPAAGPVAAVGVVSPEDQVVHWGHEANVTLTLDSPCPNSAAGGLLPRSPTTVRVMVRDDLDGTWNITGPRELVRPVCSAPTSTPPSVQGHYLVRIPPRPAAVNASTYLVWIIFSTSSGERFEAYLEVSDQPHVQRIDLA